MTKRRKITGKMFGVLEIPDFIDNKKPWNLSKVFRFGRDGETRTHTSGGNKILSLARLPVPPHPHKLKALIIYL